MAGKNQKPYSQLSRTAKYYRDNPEARKKHRASSKRASASPAAKKKRAESKAARRAANKAGKNIKGKDAAHTSKGIVFKDSGQNRGSNSDTSGDKKARGKGARSFRRKKKK